MQKYDRILFLLIICSFLLSGCSKKTDSAAEMVAGTIAKEELFSCIQLGVYQGVSIEMPQEKEVTEEDIQEQIDYYLKKAGESALTEQNVKSVSGYDSIAEYKTALKESLEKLNQSSLENEIMNQAWDAAVEQATLIKYPQDMFRKELSEVKANYEGYTQMMGMTYDEVLDHFGLTEEEIRKKAMDYVKSDLLVYAIAEAENITMDDKEYQQEMDKRMEFYHAGSEQELSEMLGGGADLHFVFLADKVIQFVYENAEIVENKG